MYSVIPSTRQETGSGVPATTVIWQGYFGMSQKFFGRNAALVGIAVFALAGLPAGAATGPQNSAAPPSRPNAICANSSASIKQFVTIGNSRDDGFQCLGLSMEGEVIKGIRLETHRFVSTGEYTESEQIETKEFSLATVEGSHGAVLDGVPGHDAIILQGHFSAPAGMATVVIAYLYNGFTGEYRNCQMKLIRAPDASWHLVDRLAQTVSHIVVRTRDIPLIGAYGIANLDGACT